MSFFRCYLTFPTQVDRFWPLFGRKGPSTWGVTQGSWKYNFTHMRTALANQRCIWLHERWNTKDGYSGRSQQGCQKVCGREKFSSYFRSAKFCLATVKRRSTKKVCTSQWNKGRFRTQPSSGATRHQTAAQSFSPSFVNAFAISASDKSQKSCLPSVIALVELAFPDWFD